MQLLITRAAQSVRNALFYRGFSWAHGKRSVLRITSMIALVSISLTSLLRIHFEARDLPVIF